MIRRSLIFIVAAVIAGGAVSQEVPTAECSYSRAAEQARSGPAVWHRISAAAELVAPSSADSGRHRAAAPPPSGTFSAVNFVDSEIFGKMSRDSVRWTAASSDTEFLRRVTLDLTSEIPGADDVKAFL